MSYIKIMIAQDLARIDNAFRCSRDEMLRMMSHPSAMNHYAWCPQTDIFETATELEFIIELAGVMLEDIAVEADRRTLRIYGIRRERRRRQDGSYLLAEIPAGYFERFFPLAVPIDTNTVQARYAEGLLHVHLEKLPQKNICNVTVRSI